MKIFTTTAIATILFLAGCASILDNQTDKVRGFFNGLNQGDYNLVSTDFADDIVTKEMNHIVSKNIDEFKVIFKWDSVFEPHYEILEVEQINQDSITLVASKFCKRVDFLMDSALIYKSLFHMDNDKIKQIETIEFVFLDFDIWGQRKDSLVNWISENHSELNGFIHDMTPNGAENYLKAIELYRNR